MDRTGEHTLPKEAIAHILRDQYRLFFEARRIGDVGAAWKALEWAHVIAQPYWDAHLVSHWTMLTYAASQRNWREMSGQALRLFLVPLGSLMRQLPAGNNGRANVSAFKEMPMPPELAALIDSAWKQGELQESNGV